MSDLNSWTTVSHIKKERPVGSSASAVVASAPKPVSTPSYWPETVVLRKDVAPPTVKVAKGTSGNSMRSSDVARFQNRIEADAEEGTFVKKKTYTDAFRQKLIDTRRALGNLTQKEFATRLSVHETLIKGIENKTANYDPQLVTKITNTINRLLAQKTKADQAQAQILAKSAMPK